MGQIFERLERLERSPIEDEWHDGTLGMGRLSGPSESHFPSWSKTTKLSENASRKPRRWGMASMANPRRSSGVNFNRVAEDQ